MFVNAWNFSQIIRFEWRLFCIFAILLTASRVTTPPTPPLNQIMMKI